jgi:hypothetical protein
MLRAVHSNKIGINEKTSKLKPVVGFTTVITVGGPILGGGLWQMQACGVLSFS